MTPAPDRLRAELFERVKRHFASADGCHDFDHTLRVLRNARILLAGIPDADRGVTETAALLHDIGRAVGDGRDHAVTGAALAASWLADCGAGADFVSSVSNAILRHRFRGGGEPPRTIEEKIIYDADKLDSLGACGVGRAFLFAGRCGARLHNTPEQATGGVAYGREDTAYREFLVKLRHLPERMYTDEGRKLGRERLRFMEEFFAALDRETESCL